MAKYDKIVIASKMLVESHNKFVNAKEDIDYIISILLSGAVVGIVSPLLKEQGGHTAHELLARMFNFISEDNDEKAHEGMFRQVYNSLKHAGKEHKGVKASKNLEFGADLKLEAAHMLDAARDDFKNIKISIGTKNRLSAEFIDLLESLDDYA